MISGVGYDILNSNKKCGSGSPLWLPALVLATVTAFSRLYLYVHWPTDILGGILLGAAVGWAGARLAQTAFIKPDKK